jgi:hypothetical protein
LRSGFSANSASEYSQSSKLVEKVERRALKEKKEFEKDMHHLTLK